MIKHFILLLLALYTLIACNNAPMLTSGSTVFGTLELNLEAGQSLKQAKTLIADNKLEFSSSAFSTVDVGSSRYINAVFSVKNISGASLKNITLYAYNNLSDTTNPSLGGSAVKKLDNFAAQRITDSSVAQSIKPAHGVTSTGSVDANRADFQAFTGSEVASLQSEARVANQIGNTDSLLEYGFVVRNGNTRTLGNNQTGSVTIGLKLPRFDQNLEPYKFVMTFVLASMTNTRVTRDQSETTAQAQTRALDFTDRSNPTEIALVGSDSDTANCSNCSTIRIGNPVVSTSGTAYLETLNVPTNFAASVISDTQVDLSWTAVSGATGYTLERAIQNGEFNKINDFDASTTNYSDTSKNSTTGSSPNFGLVNNIVTAGTKYSYRLRANKSNDNSLWASVSATTSGDLLNTYNQEPIEFRVEKLSSDGSYQFTPFTAYWGFVYLPGGYFDAANARKRYPTIVFRHGAGEYGGTSGRANLTKLFGATTSPPGKIRYNASFRPDMIVVSPQLAYNLGQDGDLRFMDALRDYLERNYRVDTNAFHITGLSAGTGLSLSYAVRGAKPVASWSIMSNRGTFATSAAEYAKAASIPNWHSANILPVTGANGEDSGSQNGLIGQLLANGGALVTNGGKITQYYYCKTAPVVRSSLSSCPTGSGLGHDAWTKGYDATNSYQNPNFWEWVRAQHR